MSERGEDGRGGRKKDKSKRKRGKLFKKMRVYNGVK